MDSITKQGPGRPKAVTDPFLAMRQEQLALVKATVKLRQQIELIVDNNAKDLASPGLINRQGQLELMAANSTALVTLVRCMAEITKSINSGEVATPLALEDPEEIKRGLLA